MTVNILNKYHGKADGVYIGRGSPFGNPYPIGEEDRDTVCDKYEHHFSYKLNTDPHFQAAVDDLVNKARTGDLNLICFCAPKRCHGETIKRHIEAALNKPANKPVLHTCTSGKSSD
jgi:hypothetical protein